MLQSHVFDRTTGAFSVNTAPQVFVDECQSDLARVAVPGTDVHLVVRLGPHIAGGFDIHALGPRHTVRRKLVRGGQSTVFARLPLGTYEAVLGKPVSEFVDRVVALRDFWDAAATQRLEEQLARAGNASSAAILLKSAIAERLASVTCIDTNTRLVQSAALRLKSRSVASVADDLGVSERHLRRLFGEVIGMSPKVVGKLMRFERALKAATDVRDSNWSDIAVDAGYYDQAHLIADFRSIAGATPREFLAELCNHS